MQTTIIGAALLLAVATPSGAQTQTQAPASQLIEGAEGVIVSYGDLDLSQSAGMKMLDHRLKTAARRTCDTANLPIDHYLVRHWCIKDAVSHGWAQVAARRAGQYGASATVTLAALRTPR